MKVFITLKHYFLLYQFNITKIFLMKKIIQNGHTLKMLINNFLRNKVKFENPINAIEQASKSTIIDRMNVINIYKIISDDSNNKLISIINKLDKNILANYQKDLSSPMKSNEHFKQNVNISLSVYRIIALVKYNMSYEQISQNLLEYILTNQISRSEILILLNLVQVKPPQKCAILPKLILNILDILLQHLKTRQVSPSFIISVTKYISKSSFRISNQLKSLLNQKIDHYIDYFDFQQLFTLSHYIREKSLLQMIKIGQVDASPIRKRIIYQLIINKKYGGLQMRNSMPGKHWETQEQLDEAMGCIKSIGVKERYIDIFNVLQNKYEKEAQGRLQLQRPQFTSYFIENIFNFIKNSYHKFDNLSYYNIIKTLKPLFSRNQRQSPSKQYFQQTYKRYNLNLWKLFLILAELKSYKLFGSTQIEDLFHNFMTIVSSCISVQYIKYHDYSNYKYMQTLMIYYFMYGQSVNCLRRSLQKTNEPYFNIQKIDQFIKHQKEKKYINNQYSKLSAFHRFTKIICQSNQLKAGTADDILTCEKLNAQQIKRILDVQNQNEAVILVFQQKLDQLIKNNKYKILRNVLLQPNVEISYLIVDEQQKKVLFAIDYQEGLIDRSTYQCLIDSKEGTQPDLTYVGRWKRDFINNFYSSSYTCCKNEKQLSQKLFTIIKKLIQ